MATNGWEYVGKKKSAKRSVKSQKKEVSDPTEGEGISSINCLSIHVNRYDTSLNIKLYLNLNLFFKFKGYIKLSETAFEKFNQIESRKQNKQNNKSFNNNKSVVDQNQENETIDKKVVKTKTKKKTISPNASPKTQNSLKPLSFEQLAKEVCVFTIISFYSIIFSIDLLIFFKNCFKL